MSKIPEKLKANYKSLSRDRKTILEFEILEGLSIPQMEACVHKDGPLLVVAGPGSGKTETMIRRAAALIRVYDIPAEKIVLTTFTDKATESLRGRIKKFLTDNITIEKLNISTIHSFCLSLLEEFGIESGHYTKSLRVLEDERLKMRIYNKFEGLGLLEFFEYPSEYNIKEVISCYSRLQEKGADTEALLESLIEEDCGPYLWAALNTFENYRNLLKEAQAVDYSMILLSCYELLQNNEVLKKVQDKFEYLMIDEYQDTNPLQDKIIRLIAGSKKNIVVVGDDDQSIYRFRGSTVTNFIEFKNRVDGCEVINLDENRRCTPEIVAVSEEIVKKIPSSSRMNKKLFTNNMTGEKISISSFENSEAEIEQVVQKIKELKEKKIIKNYHDVAILSYSISSIFPLFEDEFKKANIPFVVRGDKSFDSAILFNQIVNAMHFMVKKEAREISNFGPPLVMFEGKSTKDELDKIKPNGEIINAQVSEQYFSNKKDAKKILGLIELRKEIVESNYSIKSYSDLVHLLYRILEKTDSIKNFIEMYNEEGETYLSQIGNFSGLVSSFCEETNSRKFSSFSEFLKIIKKSMDAPSDTPEEDAVVLQTIHQSKGLEYPVVFMPNLVKGRFPTNKKDGEFPYVDGLYEFWKLTKVQEDKETDFRRLMYVGMTRAKRFLFMSYFRNTERQRATISPYLNEVLKHKEVKVFEDEFPSTKKKLDVFRNIEEEKPKLSSSHLNYFVYCPLRYKLALEKSLKTPQRGYFAFGNSLHSSIEEISNYVRSHGIERLKEFNTAKLTEILKRNWSHLGFYNRDASNKQFGYALNHLIDFVKNQGPLISKIKTSEEKFNLELDNFILTGKIDAVSEDDSANVIVVDFKSGKRKAFEKEPEYTFVNNQAAIYIEALERKTGRTPKEFHLHFLGEPQEDKNKYLWIKCPDKAARNKAVSELEVCVDKIQNRSFEPVPKLERSEKCSNCEYGKVCPHSDKRIAG